ncbi:hypothetical protein DFH09DRAFT_899609, partial [Mycena vulgaris]
SPVFRDMIAFSQPTSEQIDGSPVVRLHDSAREVEVFLRAIYDSSYFMPAPVPVELWVVLAILRLSKKYDIQYLHRRALDHLVQAGWYKAGYDDDRDSGHLTECDPDNPMDNLSLVTTATEIGALWLLPYAYYCASTFSAEDLLPFLQDKQNLM